MDHDDSAKATGEVISKAIDEKHEVESEKESTSPTTTLSDKEKEIIDLQLTAPTLTVGYFSLFRYATAKDKAIMAIALIASIAAGAVMPLMTVSNAPNHHYFHVPDHVFRVMSRLWVSPTTRVGRNCTVRIQS